MAYVFRAYVLPSAQDVLVRALLNDFSQEYRHFHPQKRPPEKSAVIPEKTDGMGLALEHKVVNKSGWDIENVHALVSHAIERISDKCCLDVPLLLALTRRWLYHHVRRLPLGEWELTCGGPVSPDP